ncbi:hypothetical protein SAMN06265373_105246 [Shimia sagamensis]|uniref:Transposase n=1 Tax=Shimia sagamensis TaxID=1566352 RepID=A0ABY1P4Q6_9RHOB|nr:hypothetical protein SAMN06265373_105246 [Shimia sagamensis]
MERDHGAKQCGPKRCDQGLTDFVLQGVEVCFGAGHVAALFVGAGLCPVTAGR